MSLTQEEKQTLLTLARETIAHAVHGRNPPSVDLDDVSENLRREGASFVTLTKWGQLRGCIGSLQAEEPLILNVRKNALEAAFRDPRFPPVEANEAEELKIEVSVLSAPQLLDYDDADELIDKLRPGVDGVLIKKDWHRATFLPQVWEKIPDPHQFLQRLCFKANLSPDDYRQGDLEVYVYQVEKFEE